MKEPCTTNTSSRLDYNPFGMMMVGRSWEAGSDYRYGFGGMERVDDVYGINNSIDFGTRIYDPRLGRWLSTDPLERKYPNVSPYTYVLDNPILYLDIGGRDVGVSIEKYPSGVGGKITLTSTIYVTGVDCTDATAKFNSAFADWSKNGQNTGSYTDENGAVWEIEITMDFKVASDEDVVRIKNAAQGAASENLIEIDPKEERSHVESLPGDDKNFKYITLNNGYKDASSEYQLGMRYSKMELGDGGGVAIHEVLHLYGLRDRYTDGFYEILDANTGQFLFSEVTYSHPHIGYEDNVMGAQQFGEMNLNQTQFDNLGKAVFKAQLVVDYQNGAAGTSTSFTLSRAIGNVEKNDSKIRESYIEGDKTYQNFNTTE